MNRISLFCLPAILLASIFISSCTGNQQHKSMIKLGTTVVIMVEKDSITMGADSRTQVYTSPDNFHFSDTTNKIFKAGNFFCAFAGTESLGDQPLKDIVIKNYDPTKKLEDNCDVLSQKLTVTAQEYYSLLSPEQKNLFNGKDMGRYQINLDIAGYEKNKPLVGIVVVNIKKQGDNYIAVPDEPMIRNMTYQIVSAGFDDHLRQLLLQNAYHASYSTSKDVPKLISFEAKYHPEVDSNVNYVVIKKQSFRLGNNYK